MYIQYTPQQDLCEKYCTITPRYALVRINYMIIIREATQTVRSMEVNSREDKYIRGDAGLRIRNTLLRIQIQLFI
jgi:hypothetical protein